MSIRCVSVEEAINSSGLRMVVVGQVPSAWGEATKGLLHIKRIGWLAVRLVCHVPVFVLTHHARPHHHACDACGAGQEDAAQGVTADAQGAYCGGCVC